MSYDPDASLQAMKAALTGTGYFTGGVLIGEPLGPVPNVTAAIFFMQLDPTQVSLADSIDAWTLCVRIYARAGMTPADAETAELALAVGMSKAWAASKCRSPRTPTSPI